LLRVIIYFGHLHYYPLGGVYLWRIWYNFIFWYTSRSYEYDMILLHFIKS